MRVSGIAVALLALLSPLSAAADDGPVLVLDLSECDELPEREVRRVLLAELGARFTDVDEGGATRAEIMCDGTRVRLLIRDPLTRKSVRRYLELRGSPEGSRARLVAIATAELLFASWAELRLNPHPVVEPAEPVAPAAARRAALGVVQQRMPRPQSLATESSAAEPPAAESPATPPATVRTPPSRPRVVALASARGFLLYPGILYGGGARFGEERFQIVSWSIDTLLEQGTLRNQGNAFDVSNASLGGIVSFYQSSRRVTARAGAGLRLGLFHAQSAAGSHWGLAPWGWPLAAVSATVYLGHGVLVEGGGEAGYVVLPTTRGSSRLGDSSFQGAWVSTQLGLGLEL